MLTADDLRALLVSIDRNTYKFMSSGESQNYTIWTPLSTNTRMSDDAPEEIEQTVQIDRYQTQPDDTIVWRIIGALDARNAPVDELVTDHDPANSEFRWIITCRIRRV